MNFTDVYTHTFILQYVCARARARVCVCVCVCVRERERERERESERERERERESSILFYKTSIIDKHQGFLVVFLYMSSN